MPADFRNSSNEYIELLKPLKSDQISVTGAYHDASFHGLLDYALERSYLANLSEVEVFPKALVKPRSITWIRIARLPIHPTKVGEYELLSRWQSVLATLHAWGHRLIYVLLRENGKTHLLLGAVSLSGIVEPRAAAAQLCQAAKSQMPGMDLRLVSGEEFLDECIVPLTRLNVAGAVTGLPSLRTGNQLGLLQTLDQVAFGIRDFSQDEYDYAFVAIADPVSDAQIAEPIHVLRQLGSNIHSFVEASKSSTHTESEGKQGGISLNFVVASIMSLVVMGNPTLIPFLAYSGLNNRRTLTAGDAQGITTRHLDKTAQYCEQVIDKHIARFKKGRNLGFWNTGVYVLAGAETTVNTITGILRSVYSGEESYIEPIRVHLLKRTSGAAACIQQFQHVPLPCDETWKHEIQKITGRATGWHPLGAMFENITTPLNTEELSIVTSLPRRDVPGLRFVRTAVRFATNPPELSSDKNGITIGNVMDMGVELEAPYCFDLNSLVKHVLITGVTGSGKSTTCRRLLEEVISRSIPVLIIEPTKDEYVRWAIAHNKQTSPDKHFQIFMPGRDEFDGVPLQQLKLNAFEPAGFGNNPVDFSCRYERLSAILRASLPMSDILPTILEEVIYLFMQDQIGGNFSDVELSPRDVYPKLDGLINKAQSVIQGRGYDRRVQDNLIAAIKTRISALTRGRRGRILNVEKSTPFDVLFESRVVVNLSEISDDRDKALIMSLLLMALNEYRSSIYRNDPVFRDAADRNELRHLAIIEEAHRLLKNAERDLSGIGNPQAIVSAMFSEMLCEVRAYGQGIMIVDQVPARLIPDAIKNTNFKIVHRLVASDDRLAMASCMALRPDQQDILAVLPVGSAIVCGDLDDAASWVRIKRKTQPE
jgi:DNA helicase HerA-like ATPase